MPDQYQSWGAPPPSWYINELMAFEAAPYYVGLLKAAEIHGARHQAVMEFQVISEKRLPVIKAGRSQLAFYYKESIAAVEEGVLKQKSEYGYYQVSGPELTALDLLSYLNASGGINHVGLEYAGVLSSCGWLGDWQVNRHGVPGRCQTR